MREGGPPEPALLRFPRARVGGTIVLQEGKRVKKYRMSRQRTILAYLFLSPVLLFFLVFFLIPIVFSLYISFARWDMLTPLSQAPLVGLKNYQYILFKDDLFLLTLKNTLVFALGTVVLNVVLSLFLAFLFTRSRFKALWRTIYWLPMVTTVSAVATMWQYIFKARGLINALLADVNISGPIWLADPRTAMPAVILVSVWAGLGGAMLIFSAGLEGIPDSYYEAARVDGANVRQEFWHITIPLLRPTILFNLVTGFIGGLSSFTLIMVMTQGGPLNTTNVVANYMYQVAFSDMRMGRASAMAFALFGVILLVTLIQLRVFRRGGIESY